MRRKTRAWPLIPLDPVKAGQNALNICKKGFSPSLPSIFIKIMGQDAKGAKVAGQAHAEIQAGECVFLGFGSGDGLRAPGCMPGIPSLRERPRAQRQRRRTRTVQSPRLPKGLARRKPEKEKEEKEKKQEGNAQTYNPGEYMEETSKYIANFFCEASNNGQDATWPWQGRVGPPQ